MTLVDGGLYKIINLSSAKPASILLPGYDGGDGLASNKSQYTCTLCVLMATRPD